MGYVYKITNTINNKSYIGISVNQPEKGRIKKHLSGKGNRIIALAINKYGCDAFTYEILEENVFDEFLPDLEVAYIAKFNTVTPYGYNLTLGGDNRLKLSVEHRRKISESNKGRYVSDTTRRKISEAQKGKKRKSLSVEHRRKISESNRGKTMSAEARRKIGEANKNPSEETRRKLSEAKKGKKLSTETRRKLSEAKKGKKLSTEHRQKISKSLKGENNYFYGKKHSAETRQKISKSLKGKKHSAETRQKISEAKQSPEYPTAYDVFLALPPDMPLKEKRKLLYTKFPNVNKRTIRSWVCKWILKPR